MDARGGKRALFIAYEFPPMGGVASVRLTKCVKYLRGFGWEPVVVTTRDAPTNLYDAGMLDELPPAINIRRTFSLEPTRLLRLFRRLKEMVSKGDPGEAKFPVYSYSGLPFQMLSKLKGLFIPDEKIGWFPFALYSSLKAVRETGPRVIFSSAPPFTTHLVAAACKAITGLPWVCEFRDPLVDYTLAEPATFINEKINSRLENFMVRRADAVICAWKGIMDGFLSRYPDIEEGRYHVITGGYDPEDFAGSRSLEKKFTMTWIGTMYGSLCPAGFLAAFADMIKGDLISMEDCVLQVVGTMDMESLGTIRELGLTEAIKMTGFVPHAESIARMRSSHLLLMQLGGGRVSEMVYAGKMFEYLASRRPILALVYEGATADLIRRMRAGDVVRPDDEEAIRETVLRYYREYKAGVRQVVGDEEEIASFDKKELTGKLASVFDELAGSHLGA